jgi:hypothetical protein
MSAEASVRAHCFKVGAINWTIVSDGSLPATNQRPSWFAMRSQASSKPPIDVTSVASVKAALTRATCAKFGPRSPWT